MIPRPTLNIMLTPTLFPCMIFFSSSVYDTINNLYSIKDTRLQGTPFHDSAVQISTAYTGTHTWRFEEARVAIPDPIMIYHAIPLEQNIGPFDKVGGTTSYIEYGSESAITPLYAVLCWSAWDQFNQLFRVKGEQSGKPFHHPSNSRDAWVSVVGW